MKRHVALYQNKDIVGNTFSYRCIITDNHENERKYDISHYSAKRLTELMYDKDIAAKVSMIGIITALHYWIKKEDNNQLTREKLIKAQQYHKDESQLADYVLSLPEVSLQALVAYFEGYHTRMNLVLSALLAMAED